MEMYPSAKNVFQYIEKPKLEDCYICLDQICDKLSKSAVFPFKCRHPVCINCIKNPNTNIISFSILSSCGICRATQNRYITESKKICKVPYTENQSIFVPTITITNDTLYRDHIQHILAHSF